MRRVAYPPEEQHLLWKRLIPLTPINKTFPDVKVFHLLFDIMLTRIDFHPSMAPFSSRTEDPEWLTRAFPLTEDEHKNETFVIWRRFLVPQFLSAVISDINPGLVAYQPNLVARQFGICQFVPKSLFYSLDILTNILCDKPWSVVKEDVEALWKNDQGSIPSCFNQPSSVPKNLMIGGNHILLLTLVLLRPNYLN